MESPIKMYHSNEFPSSLTSRTALDYSSSSSSSSSNSTVVAEAAAVAAVHAVATAAALSTTSPVKYNNYTPQPTQQPPPLLPLPSTPAPPPPSQTRSAKQIRSDSFLSLDNSQELQQQQQSSSTTHTTTRKSSSSKLLLSISSASSFISGTIRGTSSSNSSTSSTSASSIKLTESSTVSIFQPPTQTPQQQQQQQQQPHESNNNTSDNNNNNYCTLYNYNISHYQQLTQYQQRMTTELSEGERRFVFELEGKEPDFVLWVKKTNKKDVVQDRLFVLTQYRIYSIKRNAVGKKSIVRQGHLYDLIEIKTDDIDRVLLKFTGFVIDISGSNTGITIPKILINAFHRISFTFSLEASPSLIIIPVERAAPEVDHVEPGFAHGFVEVYKAQCNYYATPVNNDLIHFLEETVEKGSRVFCLDDFSGIDKTDSGSTSTALNMVPVMAALRHNTFFDTFICHNKTRKEVPLLLADVMHHNRTIVRVDLRGVESDKGWVQLGEALKENQCNELRFLDVSDNQVRDNGIISIATAIRSFTREFCQLTASNIELQSKGAAVTFRTLQSNYASSGGIEILDFSRNHLGAAGSEPLADWLALLNTSNQSPEKPLKHINLEGAQIETPRITTAIRQANLAYLTYLNLSENRINNDAVQSICHLISKGEYLQSLLLRGCGLLGEHVSLLVTACTNGPATGGRMLDLSANNFGKNGATSFAACIKSASNIDTLNLANNNFRKNGMTSIISALEENSTLRSIDLSNNLKSGSKADAVVDHLARVVQKHSTLERLILTGNTNKGFFLGRELSPLVKSINEDSKLVELDISGNNIGDDLCRELFESLKKNTYLRVLQIDNNSIGLPGFAAMKRCFTVNRSLTDIPVPTRDIAKLLSAAKDRKQTNDRISEILNDISWCLANNKNGVPYTDVPSATKTTVAVSTSGRSTPNFQATTYTSNPSSPMINRSNDDLGYSRGLSSSNFNLSASQPNKPTYAPPPPLVPKHAPTLNKSMSSMSVSNRSASSLSFSQHQPPAPQYHAPPPQADYSSNGYSNHQQQDQYYDNQNGASNYQDTSYDNSAQGYDNNGYSYDQQQQGYDQTGYDQNGYDQNGYDQNGYNYDQQGYDQQYDTPVTGTARVPPPPPM
ncbi:hypothetical protein SAMD00019534_000930 [Acytostelium subglobosum LB1]|uniref:hypothetical protein n=1 Tax=Acytostelium subglobosum LB1 TaxID=1410327 RepID=UPI000644A580|nr:hypothetical protein SAMD00019534_000930 [Acytostelium subglobosum LB1]GAM16918.1 hypothetical protein SAMD00019534_000930 [Acytostelium subglobosum LB1]|eukprot:XP_012758980.1 hypothetical protein SAMD00019534_000930 [Acytostelium subglobosum LB1]